MCVFCPCVYLSDACVSFVQEATKVTVGSSELVCVRERQSATMRRESDRGERVTEERVKDATKAPSELVRV